MKKKDEITELLQKRYGFSDEDLLRDFKAVEAEMDAEGGSLPDPEGFERLWEKLQQDKT